MKERWENSILRCIDALGGKADLKEIYEGITEFIELNKEHLTKTYGRPNYHHQIRSHITNLYQSGELIKRSRGCYSLTKKGREKLSREKQIEL